MELDMCRRWLFVLVCTGLPLFCACGKEKEPLTREQIEAEREKVDTLYLTEDGRKIIAPGDRARVIVDNGELAWAAWQCDNPDCPGRVQDDRPYLFIQPSKSARVGADGQVEHEIPTDPGEYPSISTAQEVRCPQCLKTRQLESETPEVRRQYRLWCQYYVLPESAKRLAELDEEYQRYLERLEQYGSAPQGGE